MRHSLWHEHLLFVLVAVFVFVMPASAAMRFQERSLFIANQAPGVTTSYTVSFRYMSPIPVGSVDLLFCLDPIPYHPCETPDGLDVSGAFLADQTGETGFSILSQSENQIVLTRIPDIITSYASSYRFNNIVNPTDTSQAFSIRMKSHTTPDASGPQVDFGSVRAQVTDGIIIQTQVPPMLIFCVAGEVSDNCTETNETYYADMGTLTADSPVIARSQMAVGTNATGGFAITVNGATLAAGINTIDPLEVPTESQPGQNQFGINLVENTAPSVGANPEGPWANAIATPDYSIPDQYKFVSGDVVAFSPNVSLMKKFTVSYVVNASETLRAGVYTTTVTYIASGRF